jgi:hypothetical protein
VHVATAPPVPIHDNARWYLTLKISPTTRYIDPLYENAVLNELKKHIRELREELHPDRAPQAQRKALTQKSQKVGEAFEEVNTREYARKYCTFR